MKNVFIFLVLCLSSGIAQAQDLPATLTAGVWKVTDIGIDNNGDGSPEVKLWKACREGSTYTFNAGGIGTYFKGPAPCNKDDAATTPFMWSVTGATLSISTKGKSEPVMVTQADAQHIVLWFTQSKIRFVLSRG